MSVFLLLKNNAGKITETSVPVGAAQVVETSLAVDTSTASAVFVDLLTLSITITGSALLLLATVSVTNTNPSVVSFAITVDGTQYVGAATSFTAASQNRCAALMVKVTGLAAGSRSVKLRWKRTAGTISINPATAPDDQHAALTAMEV